MAKPPKKPAALSSVAYKNILGCTEVDIGVRDRYLDIIASAGKDIAQAKLLHDTFRSGKSLLGTPTTPVATEALGNLASLEGLKHYSYRHFNPPGLPTVISYALFRSTVDGWVEFHERVNKKRKPTSAQRLAAMAIQGRSILVRDSEFLWLFRNPKNTSYAFEDLVDKWLSNRLGLASLEPRLTLSFPAAEVGPLHKPTFLDARWEDLDYWDASGKTRPVKGTPTGVSGLEEVVASPPTFRKIHGPIHKI
jgi:hypothetical protein